MKPEHSYNLIPTNIDSKHLLTCIEKTKKINELTSLTTKEELDLFESNLSLIK